MILETGSKVMLTAKYPMLTNSALFTFFRHNQQKKKDMHKKNKQDRGRGYF